MNPQDDVPATGPSSRPAGPADDGLLHDNAGTPAMAQALQTLARELMTERRRDRRWRIFFRLAWLGLVLAVLWIYVFDRNHRTTPSGPHTALVDLHGEISSDSEARSSVRPDLLYSVSMNWRSSATLDSACSMSPIRWPRPLAAQPR